jgi:hypothetical protein
MTNEFSVLIGKFNGIKMFAYRANSVRIAHCNDGVCYFFGASIDMINSTSVIDD